MDMTADPYPLDFLNLKKMKHLLCRDQWTCQHDLWRGSWVPMHLPDLSPSTGWNCWCNEQLEYLKEWQNMINSYVNVALSTCTHLCSLIHLKASNNCNLQGLHFKASGSKCELFKYHEWECFSSSCWCTLSILNVNCIWITLPRALPNCSRRAFQYTL